MDSIIKKVKKRSAKIYRKHIIRALATQVVPIVSYISSLLAIITLKYFKENQFYFNTNSISDYAILLISIALFLVGLISILRELKVRFPLIVSRDQLHDLLTLARYNAEYSIINFAGDLSWLAGDFESINIIKKLHPNVTFTIFYDKEYTSSSALPLIKQLQDNNIANLIPYINNNSMKIKCMVTDLDSDNDTRNSSKIFIYTKLNDSSDKFIWQQFSAENKEIYHALESILYILKNVNKPQLKIGISGVNNIGKTTLVKLCNEELSRRHDVKIYNDFFSLYNKKTLYHNICILFSQSIMEASCKNKINIFDRTLLDNFVYACIREEELQLKYLSHGKVRRDSFNELHPDLNSLYETLYPSIISQLNTYDLIVFLRRKNDPYTLSTTHVSSLQRKKADEMLTKFYSNYTGTTPILALEVDSENFDASIKNISKKVIERIGALYNTGKI